MQLSKKLISLITVLILLLHTIQHNANASFIDEKPTVNIAVFLHSTPKIFIYSRIKESLEDIEKENPNIVKFTFFDSRGNQGIQNENIDKALKTGNFDLYVVTPITQDIEQMENSVLKIIQKRIPLIILAPPNPLLAKYLANSPSVIIGGNDEYFGIEQGKLIVNTWKTNKENLDKNKDNKIQYVILKGPLNDPATIARSRYSIETINYGGIQTEELFNIPCNWEYQCAVINMELTLLTSINKIEVIISNNDVMAIAAVEALQKLGYNKGDSSKYIPVFGINGLPEAIDLINQGAMAGTVMQEPREYANAIYSVGMNLISGVDPLSGTNYKFDDTGKIIRIPDYR